jgi:hypothetical protein
MAIDRLSDVVGPANGLVKIVPTSVSVGSGSASVDATGNVLIGSLVSTVTVNGAFSSAFDNYKIIISGGALTTGIQYMNLRLGATSSNYRCNMIYTPFASAGVTTQTSASTDRFFAAGVATTTGITADMDVMLPFIATNTVFRATFAEPTQGGHTSGLLSDTTSYTSFTVYPAASTMSGGTVRVYGYNN